MLDYEYYFKLTDSFLQNNITDALLLFNDMLNNGFDGSFYKRMNITSEGFDGLWNVATVAFV